MKIRHFISYFWLILMFVGSSFGIFYVITGQNIITGQTRDVKDVLPAKDKNEKNLSQKISNNSPKTSPTEKKTEEVKKEDISPELLKFNEVMSKTSNKSSFKLVSKNNTDTESAIFFRFGSDSDTDYVAVYSSGLDDKKRYFAWLSSPSEYIKLGELKKVDDSNVLKLGASSKDKDYTDFTKAYITVEDTDKNDKLLTEKVAYSADLKFDADSTTPTPSSTPKITPTPK